MMQTTYLVVGAKGGVGATALAFELADRLGAHRPRALVDADFTGRRSHAVWFDVAAALDAYRLPGAPAIAEAQGKSVLELTRSYEDGFAVTQEAVEEQRLRLPEDAVVIVDAPQPFAAAVRPFLVRAVRLILVTEPTLLGVASARSMLVAMRRFGIPADRIVLVLNDVRAARELACGEIEQALRHDVTAELPQRRDRRWNRAFETLVEALPTVAPNLITTLQSSPRPLGDRRAARPLGETPAVVALPRAIHIAPERERLEAIKLELHEQILAQIDFHVAARAHSDAEKLAQLRAQVEAITATLLEERSDVPSSEEAAEIRREIVEEALGLGPIESLLRDHDVSEIMVNGCRNVYVERRGRIERTPLRFANDQQVRFVIERMIAPLGRRIDEASPMVDARLSDGSRVNAIIEPLAIDGPTLTIRRFGTRRLSMGDLVRLHSLSEPTADFLRAAVEARLNVVVSGGTGSGKTTLLNCLSSFINRAERIVTIEDAAELLLDQPHVVRLESRPANLEGAGAVTIRDLFRNSLRMRPDRIVVGECRGGEALDMLQAMNSGHDGSLTTVHANSPRDAISRIETMVLMSGFDLPLRAIREQLANAVDIVVQVARLRDGSRRVVSLSEVVGMEGDVVTMQEIAHFRQRGVDPKGAVIGEFETTGVQPACLDRFAEMGIEFDVAALNAAPQEEPAWALR